MEQKGLGLAPRKKVDLPLVRREIVIGGRVWVVETVEDQDALLDAAKTSAQFPFGMMLWEAAVGLAEEVAARPDLVDGKSVLELGCGVGLSGAVAAHYGGRVTVTDHDALALQVAAGTAQLNGIEGLSTALGDWHDWRLPRRFDVILGADVTYDAGDHEALLAVIALALSPGGVVLFADPGRTSQGTFCAAAKASGWAVTCTKRAVTDLKRPGISVDVTLLTLVRRR